MLPLPACPLTSASALQWGGEGGWERLQVAVTQGFLESKPLLMWLLGCRVALVPDYLSNSAAASCSGGVATELPASPS